MVTEFELREKGVVLWSRTVVEKAKPDGRLAGNIVPGVGTAKPTLASGEMGNCVRILPESNRAILVMLLPEMTAVTVAKGLHDDIPGAWST